MSKIYDVIVIGAGSAGISAVEAAREVGASVCLIEQEKLGGECPNWACIPSKAMLKAVRVLETMRHARQFGITASSIQVDFSQLMASVNEVVKEVTGGVQGKRYLDLMERLDVPVVFGHASFVDDSTISVTSRGSSFSLQGKTFVIATGTVPFFPPIPGLDEVHAVTFRDMRSLTSLPKSLAILGGGPVGCEFATFFALLGTRVTVIHRGSHILSREDEEMALLAQDMLKRRGVEFCLEADVKRVFEARGSVFGLEVVTPSGGEERIAAERLLVTTGKAPAVEGMNLEGMGIIGKRGVSVNAEQRTFVAHIFAAGDITGGVQFTHVAHTQGTIAGTNAALHALHKRKGMLVYDGRVIPHVTFVYPELASVGLTQAEAKKKYGRILVGTFSFAALGRAATDRVEEGQIKLIADAKTRRLVGGHILGESGGEIIHEIALAIHSRMTVEKLSSLIHAFPTYAESIHAAVSSMNII